MVMAAVVLVVVALKSGRGARIIGGNIARTPAHWEIAHFITRWVLWAENTRGRSWEVCNFPMGRGSCFYPMILF